MAAEAITASIKVPGTNVLLSLPTAAEAKTLVITRAYSSGPDLGSPGTNIQVQLFDAVSGGGTAITNGAWQISANANQFPIIIPLEGLGVKSAYIYCNSAAGTGGISGCLLGV